MLLTQANWPSIVQKDLSEVFVDQYRDFQSMLPMLYRFVDAQQGTEYDLEAGDVGSVPVYTGQITYDESKEGYKKSVTETEYSLGLKVQRKLLRNDLYGVVRDQVGLLAQAFRQKKESIGASMFNDAFTTVNTVGDTLALCSTAHTSNVGGSTQSNSGTSAFSAANLEATRILMVKFQTNRDNIRTAQPDLILVPTDLHEKAFEILNSYGKVDTANNNRNFHQGRYKLAVWDNYLSDTTNWFLLDSKLMKRVLKFRQWEPVSFFRSGEFDTITQKFAGYMANGISSVDWKFVYGQNAA